MKEIRLRSLYLVMLHVIIVILAVEVIVVIRQNTELMSERRTPLVQIRTGDFFSLDSLSALNGTLPTVEPHRRKLVFIFTLHCPFCMRNIPLWKIVAAEAKSYRLMVIGISLSARDETTAFLQDSSIHYLVAAPIDSKSFGLRNHIVSVPLTLILSPVGTVERVWNGSLDDKMIGEVAGATSQFDSHTLK